MNEPRTPWHARPADAVFTKLRSGPAGLATADAAALLAEHGPNALAVEKPASIGRILADQLRSIIVFLLLGAVMASLAFGDRLEALAIAVVLVLNTLLGFVTELRARRAIEALLQFDTPHAQVLRDGHVRTIDAREVVPGDVILLEAGQQVPADGRLIDATDVQTAEAPLTGESFPVLKSAAAVIDPDTPLAERVTMTYKGTTIVAGVGRAVVTETGQATEVGRIGALIGSVDVGRTPLEKRLEDLGRQLVWLALAVAAVVAGLGALQGVPLPLVIETAIALAVAAVPEALPAVATIALAVGVRRMARRRALVRRLPAVESLGSTTVICTDKTGTLTSGEMTLVRVWAADESVSLDARAAPPPHVLRVLEAAALASGSPGPLPGPESAPSTDPVDVAILRAAEAAGIRRADLARERPREGFLPFSSERMLMAAFHTLDGRTVAYVKGAPGVLISKSTQVMTRQGPKALEGAGQDRLRAVNAQLAIEGLRVLAVAEGAPATAADRALTGLTFLGFLGLADPPAPGVKDTIARLRAAGLRTIMLTGDQRLTAEAVGRALGLVDDGATIMDGRELDAASGEGLDRAVATARAFSRIAPEHKLAIVRALQRRGEIVAMLGDGVNDAAALKQADVGVAMGRRGTDAAKQAAAIVLQDDRFETIAVAVEEGRVIVDNIRKFVFYLFSCNVGEVLVLLSAGLAGLPLPLLPLQLLWLNLVTDTLPALALALEPGDTDVMKRPPRHPRESLLSGQFVRSILFYGALITATTLAAFVWTLSTNPGSATTVAFMTLALAQIAHLGTARSAGAVLRPASIVSNPLALAGAATAVLLQIAAISIAPLARVLHLTPLSVREWVVIVTLAAVPAVVGQAAKLIGSATPWTTIPRLHE
jgi:Ca2+-transporting ATPase